MAPILDASANTTRYFTGTACISSEPPDDANIARYNTGCRNALYTPPSYPACDATITVILPVIASENSTVNYDGVHVTYRDGNDEYSISCTVAVENASGTLYAGAQKASSAVGTGVGTLDWTVSTDLPNNSGDIASAAVQHIYCDVPSKYRTDEPGNCVEDEPSPNTSDILGYNVNTVNP
jgi:hypothetical protein